MAAEHRTFLALDVDGVVVHFSKSAKNSESAFVGPYPIKWRPAELKRLRDFLALPSVVGVWLSTWLQNPELLSQLEELLGLQGLVPLRAEYPHTVELGWPGAKVLANPEFEGTSLSETSPAWWKYRSAELLLKRYAPERFAWFDDLLGVNTPRTSPWYVKNVTYERLLVKTHPVAGLLPADLDKFESWLSWKDDSS